MYVCMYVCMYVLSELAGWFYKPNTYLGYIRRELYAGDT